MRGGGGLTDLLQYTQANENIVVSKYVQASMLDATVRIHAEDQTDASQC